VSTTKWQRLVHKALQRLRDFALTVLVIGGIQILVALAVRPILFARHPVGFSMALSLVGFFCWALSFLLSFSNQRRRRRAHSAIMGPPATPIAEPKGGSVFEHMQKQAQQADYGFVLLVSSLLPLSIAFFLRLQYDLRTGLTLSDIFPPMP
jgi:hypothetical protein